MDDCEKSLQALCSGELPKIINNENGLVEMIRTSFAGSEYIQQFVSKMFK
jgi:hypothetical protein